MSREDASHHKLPVWVDRLLEWFCAPHLQEEVQGDLYDKWIQYYSVRNA